MRTFECHVGAAMGAGLIGINFGGSAWGIAAALAGWLLIEAIYQYKLRGGGR